MSRFFQYKDSTLYCHHSLDSHLSGVQTHVHEMYEIYCFIAGNASFFVEENEYILQPYDILIMRSSEIHRLRIQKSTPYERLVIHFHPSLLYSIDPDQLLLEAFINRDSGAQNRYHTSLIGLHWCNYFKMVAPTLSTDKQKRLHVISCLVSILNEIYHLYKSHNCYAKTTEMTDFSQRIIQYVDTHLFQNLSLESISESFYLSISQLTRIFQHATGMSCHKYIRAKRLLAARDLINSGMAAQRVCSTVGFRDYSAFYRAYKTYWGVSPSESQINFERLSNESTYRN